MLDPRTQHSQRKIRLRPEIRVEYGHEIALGLLEAVLEGPRLEALPVLAVQQLEGLGCSVEDVALPHAPPVVVGVAEHRGDVVPIVDLRRRFGLQPKAITRRTKWLLVDVEGRPVGLVVDAVTDVFGAGPAEQRQVPNLGVGDDARGIAAVYLHDETLVFVIDVDCVAAPAEALDVGAVQQLMDDRQREVLR